jgi:glycosyltransferase involved in cell wall biosynthesis
MRILLTVHAFPPRSTAGVEVYTLRLGRALQARGHDVLVLAAVHDLEARPYAVRRRVHEGLAVAEVVSLRAQDSLEAGYDDPGITQAARSVLATFRPDLVHVQHLLNLSAGVLDESRAAGAATVATLHDYWVSCARGGLRMRADRALCESVDHAVCARCLRDSPHLAPPLQARLLDTARRVGLGRQLHTLHDRAPRGVEAGLRLLRGLSPQPQGLEAALDRRAARLRAAFGAADLLLAPTSFSLGRALEFGLPPGRLRHVPLGAVTHPPRPRRSGPRRRFAFIGTLAPHKGVDVLLAAFRGLRSDGVSLDLWGSASVHPTYAESLRRAAADDPRIRFRGPFPEGGQDRVLAELDAVVLPSIWWETTGLVLLEALAAGLPVVASETGGVPEVVAHGTTGLLVPPGDSDALRDALEQLACGGVLAEALPALPLKTVGEGARELEDLYAPLVRRRVEAVT